MPDKVTKDFGEALKGLTKLIECLVNGPDEPSSSVLPKPHVGISAWQDVPRGKIRLRIEDEPPETDEGDERMGGQPPRAGKGGLKGKVVYVEVVYEDEEDKTFEPKPVQLASPPNEISFPLPPTLAENPGPRFVTVYPQR